jgi:hypothetical protein
MSTSGSPDILDSARRANITPENKSLFLKGLQSPSSVISKTLESHLRAKELAELKAKNRADRLNY